MIKRYIICPKILSASPWDLAEIEKSNGPWVKFRDHERIIAELIEMLEKYQSHNRIHNDTESELFEEASALIDCFGTQRFG